MHAFIPFALIYDNSYRFIQSCVLTHVDCEDKQVTIHDYRLFCIARKYLRMVCLTSGYNTRTYKVFNIVVNAI